MMGLDEPGPGSAAFHLRDLASPQAWGGSPAEMPAPPGPRNCDQSSAAGHAVAAAIRSVSENNRDTMPSPGTARCLNVPPEPEGTMKREEKVRASGAE